MDDYALVINAGSSSLKFCVYRRPDVGAWRLDARGQIAGIGSAPQFSVQGEMHAVRTERTLDRAAVRDGRSAIRALASWLRASYGSARIAAVGHRVVHGGTRFAAPVLITPLVLEDLQALIPLAPLHQPHNLAAIEVISEQLPDVPQVACFDTSFHRGRPAVSEIVPLPRELRETGIQRYGFHGLSYEYIASVLPQVAPEIASGRVVVAHLGSGSSLCAMKNGKSIDTTFGFSTLDGLCMGTRPGTLDPGVVLYLLQHLRLDVKQIEMILYNHSGLFGISGISGNMRELLESAEPSARLAVDYFVHRVIKEVAALAATLGGVDALVFTGGIGENSAEIRRRICEALAWLGIELSVDADDASGPRISRARSQVSAWVIPTNEELVIARHTAILLGLVETHA